MKLIAKTLFGLEKVLAGELISIGASGVRSMNRAVLFEGDLSLLYKANYTLRTAMSVLMPLKEFRIRSKEDLYRGSLAVAWEKYLDESATFSVVPVVNSKIFTHSGYPGLVVKDAIADYFRTKKGKRPSVNTEDPGCIINLHISNDQVTISLDSSGDPLFKRGYRKEQHAAPLNEVLAAGIIMMSQWSPDRAMLDPMCGSGTFPIEAAMIACKIPAGKFRKYFGFQRWKGYDPVAFQEVRAECDKNIVTPSPVRIWGSDISGEAVDQAVVNAKYAGLGEAIYFQVSDFATISCPEAGGTMFINPPYGLRLQPGELNGLYSMIGSTLKHKFTGWDAWLITPNRESLKHIGLKPGEKHTLFNGALECTLLRYGLYTGTRKSASYSD